MFNRERPEKEYEYVHSYFLMSPINKAALGLCIVDMTWVPRYSLRSLRASLLERSVLLIF